ncbi:unnamed protein product [Medioppia subpectinata]|uniref:acid phosphatase n=1 Tax=Medioppia subpectinata TaxID=1979941 RepID=A0A7R9KW60_9ACAR|nr:unnamed protein product [Medioppia subpectinata]CAG2109809.1 unnamed protein product [Medioppia subpectinata]
MKLIFLAVFALTLCLSGSDGSQKWPNHDISTLKLLQVVHKHGERAPVSWTPNDPYNNVKYWPEGLSELTARGKNTMFKLGQFLRQEYGAYFGNQFSPREVYARSAAADRCFESCAALLAGAYPPNQKDWQWSDANVSLGHIWQPINIQTFLPEKSDLVCNQAKHCDIASAEYNRIYAQKVVKDFEAKNKPLYDQMTKAVGAPVGGIWEAFDLYDTLKAELDNNYYWDKTWSKEDETKLVAQLYESALRGQIWDYDSPIIKRMRAGGLVNELNTNFDKVLKKTNNKKMYVYSTYGAHISLLLQSLNVFNNVIPPNAATVLFELHQKPATDNYFVRLYYQNETTSAIIGIPHSVPLTDCKKLVDCPLTDYIESTKHLIYEDYDKECVKKSFK